MSDPISVTITEVKDNSLKIEIAQAAAETTLGEMSSTLADISGIIALPAAVIQLALLLKPRTDPVLSSLQVVANLISAALHFEVTNDGEEHQFHIKDLMNPAETDWNTFNEINFNTTSPLLTLDTLQHNTAAALHGLLDSIYWYRPYYQALDYDDGGGWFHHVIPPDIIHRLGPTLPEVFDYRLVLPSFICATCIRTSVILILHAIRPDVVTDSIFHNMQVAELQPAVAMLNDSYNKIVAGFVFGRMPDSSSGPDLNAWEHAGRVIGVIDSYAGLGLIDIALPVNWRWDDQGNPVWNDDFDRVVFPVRYQLGLLRRWKSLYINTGLKGVWRTLQALSVISGKGGDAKAFDKRAAWSLKEVHTALGTVFQNPPLPGARISASDTFRRLYRVAKLPVPDPNSVIFPSQLSWRRALLTVAF